MRNAQARLLLAAIAVVSGGVSRLDAAQPEVPPFFTAIQDAACQIAFYIPADWDATIERHLVGGRVLPHGQCVVRLRQPGWEAHAEASDQELPDDTLVIVVSAGDWKKVAVDRGYLPRDWRSLTPNVRTECCFGFSGEAEEREHYKKGGYAGLGTCYRGVLTDGRNRYAFFDGAFGVEWFDAIMRGFRFLSTKEGPASP